MLESNPCRRITLAEALSCFNSSILVENCAGSLRTKPLSLKSHADKFFVVKTNSSGKSVIPKTPGLLQSIRIKTSTPAHKNKRNLTAVNNSSNNKKLNCSINSKNATKMNLDCNFFASNKNKYPCENSWRARLGPKFRITISHLCNKDLY